jgi:CO/xanthine dehydrogenase FAD-binding subunit
VTADQFAYVAPDTVEGAVAALTTDPERARAIGGGTWVIPEYHRGECTPRLLVDLRRAGLDTITAGPDTVHVGATCTYADLIDSTVVGARVPLLHAMATGITGGRQIQNQGTLGGSVAAARPQSDAPAVVVALGACALITGPDGTRRVAARDLFAGPMRTSLRPGEVLTGFELSTVPERTRWGYHKLKRSAGSWPIATAATLLTLDEDDRVTAGTLVLGGVGPVPVIVGLDDVLLGRHLSADAVAEASTHAGASVTEPWGDELAPGWYRAAVAAPVAQRALEMAAQTTTGEGIR